MLQGYIPPHLLSLLLDEEHQLEAEEGVGILSSTLTGQLLGEWDKVASLTLDHVHSWWLVHPQHNHGGQQQQHQGGHLHQV